MEKIAYDQVKRRGKPIELVDMKIEDAINAEGEIVFNDFTNVIDKNDTFKAVFIDTGENGTFSRAEFETISSLGQMEIVTPEEIATYLVHELRAGNTGDRKSVV